jgi:phosphatidylglycerophosphatase A
VGIMMDDLLAGVFAGILAYVSGASPALGG